MGLGAVRFVSGSAVVTAGPKGPRGSNEVTMQVSETAREVARAESLGVAEFGSGDESPADEMAVTLADAVHTVKVSGTPFDLAENWHDLLVSARTAGDELVELASHSSRTYWLASAAVLLVAVEMVRLQRERSSKQVSATAWPQIVAPSGLA